MAKESFLTPNFKASDYGDTTVIYEGEDIITAKKGNYVAVDQLQLIRVGDSKKEEVTYDSIENTTFLTLQLKVRAKDEPLSFSIPNLTTVTGQTEFSLVKSYSDTGDENEFELQPQETKELQLTFVPRNNAIPLEDVKVVQLTTFMNDGVPKREEHNLPISEEGVDIMRDFQLGSYPDRIQRDAIFQKERLILMELEQKKEMNDIAAFTLHGVEVAQLLESEIHSTKDNVLTDIPPGKIALTFKVSIRFLGNQNLFFLSLPTMEMNGEVYRDVRSLGTYGNFTVLNKKDEMTTQYLVFIVDEREWKKAESFSYSFGPIYDSQFEAISKSPDTFQLHKEGK